MSRTAPPAAVIDELLDTTADPLNRYYRYPAARALLPVLGWLPITPNQVTLAHTLMALAAAWIVAQHGTSPRALILAFVLLEARMILDCYDGVLARAKKISSPFGRALDEIGDTVGFVGLVAAIVYRLSLEGRLGVGIFLAFALFLTGGFTANAWDFYRRRIGSALRDGRDGVREEFEQKVAMIRSGKAPGLAWWGWWFDGFQLWLYDVRAPRRFEPDTVRARLDEPRFRRFVGFLALLSWDNGIAILQFGIPGALWTEAAWAAVGYGVVMWIAARLLARRAFAPVSDRGAPG